MAEHERYMRRALDLARAAADRGDRPFGSVLVHDGEIVMEDTNAVLSENDIRRHPELNLAQRAIANLDEATRTEMTMYTSTGPCPMCAGGMRYAEFDRVIYATSGPELAEFTGNEPATRAAAILDGVTAVEGPVCHEEGLAIHESFW